MANTWLNNDGLYLKFGTANAGPTNGGEYSTLGPRHTIEVEIDLTTLTSSAAIINDQIFFPKNARIEQVEIYMKAAATSGGLATLSVGLIQTDRSTSISGTAFVNGLALASINTLGNHVTLDVGSTSAGGSIGTVGSTTAVGYITANYSTAAFTAGTARVRIHFIHP